METFKAPEIEIINPNVSPEIEGDNSIAYENWKAYEKAVEEKYRFFSFGDCMFIS